MMVDLYKPETTLKTLNLPFNDKGRDFIIGDLHGMIDCLNNELHEVSFNPEKDRLFSVGDLIDRGPKSFDCLKLIEENWFYTVKGNHESSMVDALTSPDKNLLQLWERNGGEWWRDESLTELMYYVRLADELPYSIKVGEGEDSFALTHTDPPSDWNDVTNIIYKESMLWGRAKIKSGNNVNIKNIGRVFCGHTPRKEVVQNGNVYFIDTGACFNKGKLTMIQVSGHES